MADGRRISLANKCQLLFGAAVLLILTAALAVVWLRMQTLVEQVPQKRAQDIAEAWLSDQIQIGGVLTPIERGAGGLPVDMDLSLSLVPRDDFERYAEQSAFLGQAIERFRQRSQERHWFGRAEDAEGEPYYRYARAVRQSDLSRLRGGLAAGFGPEVEATELADPLHSVLLIQLRDPDMAAQQVLNRIYIIVAGLFAGLLAVAVFWFITTRLILSPVRLLRDVATKVSAGDLNVRSDINTGDEFEELSDAFNTMLSNQKEKQDQLRSINKSLDLKLGELAQSNIALYEANKIKGEFLANVSHELKTPLNSMIGFAEVLQEMLPTDGRDPANEKRHRYVTHIMTSSRRLLDLINDLLDLAKIEAGRIDLNVTTVSIPDVVEGLVNLIRPQANERNVRVLLQLEPGLPLVTTDAGKLQQILFNFLSNAVKFTPGGGEVTFGATLLPAPDEQSHPRIRLSVRDTGPGIPPADQARIFEKFTQLDPGVTREHGGTGLGLTISQELTRMIQGRIELDSDLDCGATFSLIISTVLEQRSVPLMPDLAGRANVP